MYKLKNIIYAGLFAAAFAFSSCGGHPEPYPMLKPDELKLSLNPPITIKKNGRDSVYAPTWRVNLNNKCPYCPKGKELVYSETTTGEIAMRPCHRYEYELDKMLNTLSSPYIKEIEEAEE